jgi:CheY-like chemotaxis protein
VVVLDYRMPGLDGAHLLRVLRGHPRTAKTPVVFYSGDCDDTLREAALYNGAQFVPKGGSARALVDAVMLCIPGRTRGAVAQA